jgi:hypothetical protein
VLTDRAPDYVVVAGRQPIGGSFGRPPPPSMSAHRPRTGSRRTEPRTPPQRPKYHLLHRHEPRRQEVRGGAHGALKAILPLTFDAKPELHVIVTAPDPDWLVGFGRRLILDRLCASAAATCMTA